MSDKKFNPKKLAKLNNPERLRDIPPGYVCGRLSVKQADTLVDLGAGTAFFSIAFQKELKPAMIYACDLSDTMIEWIREHVTPNHPGIIPVKNDESSVPLGDGVADLVGMITLHHELEDPLTMLAEAHRLLKPGGEVFIVDWKKKEMDQGPPENIRCVPEDVREQLLQTGFGEVAIYNEMPRHFLLVGKKDN